MKTPSPRMIILARESRGYKQTPLARSINVSQGFLSKVENGQQEASEDLIQRLARFLQYPESFFYQEIDFRNLPIPFYRKRKSLSQSAVAKIRAMVNIKRLQLAKLLRSVDLPELRVPPIVLREYGRPVETLAAELRTRWHIPPGPIENVTRLLENLGVLVVKCDFGSNQVDALSMHEVSDDLPPIIFANTAFPGDRLRWSLTHELAHVLLHLHLPFPDTDTDCEKEADRFAGTFLLPPEELRPYLNRINLERLASLKLHWKVSMQALIMQAAAMGKITERKKQFLFSQMGKYGYRVREPVSIPVEEPSLIGKIIQLHLDELNYSPTDLSRVMDIDVQEFQVEYLNRARSHLSVVQ